MTRSWRDALRLSALCRPHRHHSAADNPGVNPGERNAGVSRGFGAEMSTISPPSASPLLRIRHKGQSLTAGNVWKVQRCFRAQPPSPWQPHSSTSVPTCSGLPTLQRFSSALYKPFKNSTIFHLAALVFLQNTDQKMTKNLRLILQKHVFIIFPF